VDVLSRLQVRDLLLAAKPTMLFVEHDRAFVDEIATRIIPL
jgi:lincosamide and streptogramin A transport system ATP-binding/permease protein